LAVVESPGDEGAAVGIDLHFVAVVGAALDSGDSAGVNPGMASEERLSTPRLQDDTRDNHKEDQVSATVQPLQQAVARGGSLARSSAVIDVREVGQSPVEFALV
jgi:hypothetical protein